MDLYNNDKTILVTGGSKGVGFDCAKILAIEGAQVLLSSRSRENLELASEKILKISGIKPTVFPADVSSSESITELQKQVAGSYNKLDGLVINAGVPPAGPPLSKN